MSYFESVDMNRMEPDFKEGDTEILSVFHNESMFKENGYQRFLGLGNNEQVLKTKNLRERYDGEWIRVYMQW